MISPVCDLSLFKETVKNAVVRNPLHATVAVVAPICYWVYSRYREPPVPQPLLPFPNKVTSIVVSYAQNWAIDSLVSALVFSANDRAVMRYDAVQEQVKSCPMRCFDYLRLITERAKKETICEAPLNLNYLGFFPDTPPFGVDEENLRYTQIEELTFNSCRRELIYTRDDFRKILKKFPRLKKIFMQHCWWVVRASDLRMIASSQLPIETFVFPIKVWASTARIQEFLEEHKGSLRSLTLIKRGVTDDVMRTLAGPEFALTELDLSGSDVSDRGIQALAASKLPLQVLDIMRTGVTQAGVLALAKSQLPLRVLRLNVEGVKEIVEALAKSNLPLEELGLSGSPLTDEGLKVLAESSLLLSSLDVGYTQVTDEGMKALSASQLPLRKLRIEGTTVTEQGVCALEESKLGIEIFVPLKVWEEKFISSHTTGGVDSL